MATADLDADGAPDLVSGYGKAGSGALILWRGNPEAYSPSTPESQAGIRQGRFPESFLREPRLLELPESPDFVAAGEYTGDGTMDVIAAARGGQTLYVFAGLGKGEFAEARASALAAAMAATPQPAARSSTRRPVTSRGWSRTWRAIACPPGQAKAQ